MHQRRTQVVRAHTHSAPTPASVSTYSPSTVCGGVRSVGARNRHRTPGYADSFCLGRGTAETRPKARPAQALLGRETRNSGQLVVTRNAVKRTWLGHTCPTVSPPAPNWSADSSQRVLVLPPKARWIVRVESAPVRPW